MAEGVRAVLGVYLRLLQVCEHHAAGAYRHGGAPRLHDADTHCARRLVARTAHHRRALRQACRLRRLRRDAPRNLWRLVGFGEPFARQLQRVQHVIRPVAARYIEKRRARRVRNLRRRLAREPIADEVFGQQHLSDAGVVFRFVAAQPDDFARLKARQHGVQCRLQDGLLSDALGNPRALIGGALVAPQQRGAYRLAALVQEDRAVHLPAQADATHCVCRNARLRQHAPYRRAGSLPPVVGVLLCPQRARRIQGVRLARAGDHRARLINQQRLHARSADVYAQQVHRVIRFAPVPGTPARLGYTHGAVWTASRN
jgi:hypothetical protein